MYVSVYLSFTGSSVRWFTNIVDGRDERCGFSCSVVVSVFPIVLFLKSCRNLVCVVHCLIVLKWVFPRATCRITSFNYLHFLVLKLARPGWPFWVKNVTDQPNGHECGRLRMALMTWGEVWLCE